MDQLIAKLQRAIALSDDDRSSLLAIFSNTRYFKRGRDILREGEQPEHVHVIIDGWAAHCVTLVDGSRQTTAFLMPGDFCNGETTLLKRLDHGVVALTPQCGASVLADDPCRCGGATDVVGQYRSPEGVSAHRTSDVRVAYPSLMSWSREWLDLRCAAHAGTTRQCAWPHVDSCQPDAQKAS
jgi:hypothetical protein